MIATIAKKEWTERIRDGQFVWSGAAVVLLLVAAGGMGFLQWKTTHTERENAQRRDREQWLNQGNRNPHSAAHYGVYAFKPKLPLSFLDAGMDSFTGAVIWVEAHYQNPTRFRPAEDGTALQRFGELTAAAVLQWFVPLLIILLSFSAFTSEKEQGTLRQLLSLGVPQRKLVAGKVFGVAAALGCVIIPAVILGSFAIAATGDQTAASTWARFGPMALAYFIYLAVFAVLSLGVSALVSSSRTALVFLLGFWILNGFLVPRLAADAAEGLYPTPSATAFWREVATEMKGADGHSDSDQRILDLKRRTMEKYGVSRVEDLPVNFEGLRLQAGEEHGNEVFDDHFGRLWRAFESQERVHQWASVLSPLMAVRSVSMAMAGTDLAHLRDFTEKTEQYRRMLNKTMNLDVASNSRTGQYFYFAGKELWAKIPEYRYQPPSAEWAFHRQPLPAAILAIWLLVSTILLVVVIRKVSV